MGKRNRDLARIRRRERKTEEAKAEQRQERARQRWEARRPEWAYLTAGLPAEKREAAMAQRKATIEREAS